MALTIPAICPDPASVENKHTHTDQMVCIHMLLPLSLALFSSISLPPFIYCKTKKCMSKEKSKFSRKRLNFAQKKKVLHFARKPQILHLCFFSVACHNLIFPQGGSQQLFNNSQDWLALGQSLQHTLCENLSRKKTTETTKTKTWMTSTLMSLRKQTSNKRNKRRRNL